MGNVETCCDVSPLIVTSDQPMTNDNLRRVMKNTMRSHTYHNEIEFARNLPPNKNCFKVHAGLNVMTSGHTTTTKGVEAPREDLNPLS